MKLKSKKSYVPPVVNVTNVVLEEGIAAHSVIQSAELENWSYEGSDIPENNSDIWLNL